MKINEIHHLILVELRKNPFATLSYLSKKVDEELKDKSKGTRTRDPSNTKTSPNTIKSKLEELEKLGAIRREIIWDDPVLGERIKSSIVAHQNPYKLGLNRIVLFFNGINNRENYEKICSLLEKHPYTYFRVRGISSSMMIFAYFDIPPNTTTLMEVFASRIVSKGLASSFEIIEFNYIATSEDDLGKWNRDAIKWDIKIRDDSDNNEESFENKLQNEVGYTSPVPQKKVQKSRFDEIDLQLLRELTINADRKISEIAKNYDLGRSAISRRITKIKDNLILGYSLLYDRSLFNLDSVYLLSGQLKPNIRNALFRLINNNEFPFSSDFIIYGMKNFIWNIYCPPTILNDLIDLLYQYSAKLKLANILPKTGTRYYFYPNNYDFDKDKWRDDTNYMVDDVLPR